jgi:hypothetical protein
VLIGAWFVALVVLIVAATFATSRARARPDDVVARPVFVAVAIGYAALVATTIWTWGGTRAAEDREALVHAGARVELALRGVAVAADKPIVIGHAREATVRLPGPGPAEVARVEPGGIVHDSCTATRAHVPDGASLAIACAGLAIRVDGRAVTLEPSRAPRTIVAAGDVLRIGRADEPVPALATWEVAGPTGEVIAIPADPTSCAAWPHARAIGGGCEVQAGAFTLAAPTPRRTCRVRRASRSRSARRSCCCASCSRRCRGRAGAARSSRACWSPPRSAARSRRSRAGACCGRTASTCCAT